MKRLLAFFLIAFFSIFIGSQITEGCLLLPYWKSMPADNFYQYYSKFGPIIGQFYTVLTIIAAIIPIFLSVYCFIQKSSALKYALLSSFFVLAFLAIFYIYFKGANQQFYDATLSAEQLKQELIVWGNWHWGRIVVEILSLIFLSLALNILTKNSSK